MVKMETLYKFKTKINKSQSSNPIMHPKHTNMANIIDKWDKYMANRLGKVKPGPFEDSTMISRKKKGNKNRLRRKFARAQRRRNRDK